MALQFGTCPACQESHALRADGRMSIHTTDAGARCGGGSDAPEPLQPRERRERSARPVTYDDPDRDDGRQEAFDAARGDRRSRYGREATPEFDRKIYNVGRAQIVNGGQPGHGKRR